MKTEEEYYAELEKRETAEDRAIDEDCRRYHAEKDNMIDRREQVIKINEEMNKINEWNENISINWWKESRTQLNKVIRKYNKWIDKHTNDKVKTAKLLTKIEKHLKMDYCNQDGGSGYKEELLNIQNIIKNRM